jgi:hypothetical protein
VRFGLVLSLIEWAEFQDILTEAEVCTRSFAPVESSTGWRPAM